jgi:8-oxo-dGTP diphosphatase
MKRKGASIIFVNEENQILLVLRDDLPDLPYANMWDVPGGHVEQNETPEECIVREIQEEMNLVIDEFKLFSVSNFTDRVEYTFWTRADFDINDIELAEGQKIRWFTETEARKAQLAYGFNQIVASFYKEAPYLEGAEIEPQGG